VYVPFADETDAESGVDLKKDTKAKAPAKTTMNGAGATATQKTSAASGGAR